MNTLHDNRCILLFVKYPDRGTVKTRLQQNLRDVSIEELYRAFVLDILTVLERIAIPFIVCYYPENAEARFAAWLGTHRSFIPQRGANLGERLRNCFRYAFTAGFQRVIALGSDSPDLPPAYITDAFSHLEGNDSVIGPCEDGGYYLIGFKKDTFVPEAFNEISWSTDKVFSQTREKLRHAHHIIHVLPLWHDIDTIEDLQRIYLNRQGSQLETSKTMALLIERWRI